MAFMAISPIVLYSSFHLFFQNISSEPIIQVFFFPFEENISFFAFPLKPQVDEYIIIFFLANQKEKVLLLCNFENFFLKKFALADAD